ncbi:MAG: Crp/Fnr family transcriptional regulator [Eubacterium sp.]|nr:Crp/Fnr family transcriptional regulator [Eubacterium sp.]
MLSIEILKQNDVGATLSQECLEQVMPILDQNAFRKEVSAGETIHNVGDTIHYITILEEGSASSYCYTKKGEQILFFLFRQNESIGMLSIAGQSTYRADMVADKPGKVIYIPRENYLKAMQKSPEFLRAVLAYICAKADEQLDISILARFKYANDRICYYLYQQCMRTGDMQVPIQQSIENMANYLGLSRSVLSKGLHALEKAGVVKLETGKVIVLDLEKLKDSI